MKSSGPTGTGRIQLDREQILAAALQLAGDGSSVTIRALGMQLGADPTALYRHFRNRGDVVLATFDRLIAQTRDGIDPTSEWREKLTAFCLDFWECCVSYPSICAEIRGMTTGGPGELGAVELYLSCFREAGLDRAGAVRYYGVLSGYVISVGSMLADKQLKKRGDSEVSVKAWLGDLGVADPRAFPEVSAARAELASLRSGEVYPMGIGVILDAAAAEGAGAGA